MTNNENQSEFPLKILNPTSVFDPLDDDLEMEDIETSSQLMDRPFDPTKIDIDTKTPSLDTLIKRIKHKTVQLNTESYFQRKADLWDTVKQSRLIESILIRFPLPAFFFDATDDNNWLVVDGLQRLSSIRNFVVDKKLKLTKLEFLSHLEGYDWESLPEDLQRVIEESQVVIYKIMPGTPTDVKFNIFKRINTGGLILEPQEIRHALFQGRPAQFIAELSRQNAFLAATNYRIKTHRMLDRDFVNRFLCFYLLGVENYGSENFGKDLDTYMSMAMSSINDKTELEIEKIKSDFIESMELCKYIFEEEAFRKVYQSFERLPPINKAIFDTLSVQFGLLNSQERVKLKSKKDEMKSGLKNLLANDDKFFTSVTSSTGDKNRVLYRHFTVKNLVGNLIQK
jgi:hypothetical protein